MSADEKLLGGKGGTFLPGICTKHLEFYVMDRELYLTKSVDTLFDNWINITQIVSRCSAMLLTHLPFDKMAPV